MVRETGLKPEGLYAKETLIKYWRLNRTKYPQPLTEAERREKRRKLDEGRELEKQRTMFIVENYVYSENYVYLLKIIRSETSGIMVRMEPLPLSINEDHLNSLIQLNRMVITHDLMVRTHHLSPAGGELTRKMKKKK
uniref:Uncharacterized protein n=1 Tax=Setaria italica TaxID=4555 RepID=K4AJF2_SETIT